MVNLKEWMMILELHQQGLSVSAIAERTGHDRKTVREVTLPAGQLAALFDQAPVSSDLRVAGTDRGVEPCAPTLGRCLP